MIFPKTDKKCMQILTNFSLVNVFLTDINDFAEFNKVYAKHFNTHKPARSCVAVKSLPLGVDVSITETIDKVKPSTNLQNRLKLKLLLLKTKPCESVFSISGKCNAYDHKIQKFFIESLHIVDITCKE